MAAKPLINEYSTQPLTTPVPFTPVVLEEPSLAKGSPEQAEAACLLSTEEANPEFSNANESLETQIGQYWLSRLGIGFLVIGVALFIMYSFQHFGVFAKLATGYIVATSLILFSEFLERRKSMEWYTRVLAGGGWSLAFFTTYAMHHVHSVAVIHDPLVALFLMLAVAAGAIWHALYKHSELMSIFAVLLGFVTLMLNNVTMFSALASGILVLMTVLLTAQRKWHRLYSAVVIIFYLAQLHLSGITSATLLTRAAQNELFYQTAVFLIPGLLGFSLLPLAFGRADKNQHEVLVFASMVNAFGFIAIFLSAANNALAIQPSMLCTTAWFAAISWLFKKRKNSALATLYSLLALLLGTTYFFNYGNKHWFWLVFSTEIAILAGTGIRYKLRSFRIFAAVLSLAVFNWANIETNPNESMSLCGYLVSLNICMKVSSFIAFTYACYEEWKQASSTDTKKGNVLFYFYWHLAALTAWLIPQALLSINSLYSGNVEQDTFLLCCYMLEALTASLIGMRLANRYIQCVSLVAFFICGAWLVLPLRNFSSSFLLISLLLMYLGAVVFYPSTYAVKLTGSKTPFHIQFCFATFCSWFLILEKLQSIWISSAWALQGMLLLACGFWLRDKPIRVLGLIVFCSLIFRLFCIDLAGAETIYRIIGFIGTGLILLGSAYAYFWFTTKIEKE